MEENMIKVYVVGSSTGYARFIENYKLVDNIKDADLVLFTGGEDVDPIMYGVQDVHPNTYSNISRDKLEKKVFDSIKPNQLAVGICRGSQFLCVMNGGKLVQDCQGHAIGQTHEIVGNHNSMLYEITSTHHQMQYPYNMDKNDYDVLYFSNCGGFYSELGGIDVNEINGNGEPEVVLYKKENKPKCLAIQGHPEMIPNSPVAKMLNNLIKELLNK